MVCVTCWSVVWHLTLASPLFRSLWTKYIAWFRVIHYTFSDSRLWCLWLAGDYQLLQYFILSSGANTLHHGQFEASVSCTVQLLSPALCADRCACLSCLSGMSLIHNKQESVPSVNILHICDFTLVCFSIVCMYKPCFWILAIRVCIWVSKCVDTASKFTVLCSYCVCMSSSLVPCTCVLAADTLTVTCSDTLTAMYVLVFWKW